MGSKRAAVTLSEIYKRVPPNQYKQFDEFSKKYALYSRRMDKFPGKLPVINWEEYKRNVRADALPLVEEFEKKYNELNKLFDDRNNLDHGKYYQKLEEEKKQIMEEIENYKMESDERIKEYEAEIVSLKNLKPYKDMTMEEFCTLTPEKAKYVPYYGNNEQFWPFAPDEEAPDPLLLSKNKAEKPDGDPKATTPGKSSDKTMKAEPPKQEKGSEVVATKSDITESAEDLQKKSMSSKIDETKAGNEEKSTTIEGSSPAPLEQGKKDDKKST